MEPFDETVQQNRETIRGVVVPEQWDDQFHVTDILIACQDEREVRVENPATFPDLLALSRTEAIVTGLVKRIGLIESMVVESFSAVD